MSPDTSNVGLEKLSLTIIEVLKDLSAAKSPLTAESLLRAFERRRDLVELVSPQLLGEGTSGGNGRRAMLHDQAQVLREENRKIQELNNKLQSQLTTLQTETAALKNFSKRAVLTLLALADNPQNRSLAAALDSLRYLVLKEAGIEEQSQSLQNIKNQVMREDPGSADAYTEVSGRAASEVGGASSAFDGLESGRFSPYVPKVQNAFLSILTHLEPVSEQLSREVFSDLRVRIAKCQDMDTLVSLGDDVVGFVKSYVGKIIQQNDQVAIFAKELGKNLTEMEEQLLFSLNVTQAGHRANGEFSTTLQGQVEDIRGSFLANRSIHEVQVFVFSKLKAIRTAIEHKNAQDEIRYQQTQGSMEELKKSLQTMTTEINRVQERARTLEREILLDSLTGIHNRRAYEQRIHEEFARYRRYGMTYSLVLFDVDHFKRLNDQFGHRAGDKCLREIINRVKRCTRSTDFIARYGGEEFVILLTGTNKEGAFVVAEKVRRAIEKTRFSFQDKTLPVTISLGVSEIVAGDTDVDAVFMRADNAMYRAKGEGRNRVCVD